MLNTVLLWCRVSSEDVLVVDAAVQTSLPQRQQASKHCSLKRENVSVRGYPNNESAGCSWLVGFNYSLAVCNPHLEHRLPQLIGQAWTISLQVFTFFYRTRLESTCTFLYFQRRWQFSAGIFEQFKLERKWQQQCQHCQQQHSRTCLQWECLWCRRLLPLRTFRGNGKEACASSGRDCLLEKYPCRCASTVISFGRSR